MKEIIPKDAYGVFADNHDVALVDSRYVAQYFEKEHKTVLRNIDAILGVDSGFSPEFGRHNFVPISYKDSRTESSVATPLPEMDSQHWRWDLQARKPQSSKNSTFADSTKWNALSEHWF